MNTSDSRGFTLVELLIVVGLISIISAVAVPGIVRARMSGNEASAIGSLRAINSGEAAYSSGCASGGYAVTLDDLAMAPAGSAESFISADLKSNGVTKSGYIVTLEADATPGTAVMSNVTTCNGSLAAPASGYFAKADPATAGSGDRHFATDTRGAIFYDAATIANPITITAVVQ
jgi:prepilin-type N-terminal cleavage/methylation domain-containing protein